MVRVRNEGASTKTKIQMYVPVTADRTDVAEGLCHWQRPLLRTISALAGGFALVGAYDDAGRAIREGDPRAEVARRDAIFRRSLALADVAAAAAATLLCVTLISGLQLRAWTLLSLLLVVSAGKLIGLYDRDELLVNRGTLDEAPRLLQLATLYALVFSVLQGPFVARQLQPGTILSAVGLRLRLHAQRPCLRS